MRRVVLSAVLASLVLVVVGCAQQPKMVWYRPGTPKAEAEKDFHAARAEALKGQGHYPSRNEITAAYMDQQRYNEIFTAEMMAKGYRLEDRKKLVELYGESK